MSLDWESPVMLLASYLRPSKELSYYGQLGRISVQYFIVVQAIENDTTELEATRKRSPTLASRPMAAALHLIT